MGIGIIFMSYGLYYQVLEILPPSLDKKRQFLVSLAPILLIFVLVEWLLLSGRESFSGLIGALGGILTPLLGGIFPILMLAASRQKGEYAPQRSFAFLGKPLVMGMVYLIYLGGVLVYGFLIWDEPLQRLLAIGMGIVVLVVTFLSIRRGSFVSRAVVELKVTVSDRFEHATLSLMDQGKPLACMVHLVYSHAKESIQGTTIDIPDYQDLSAIKVEFSGLVSPELKIWTHRVTQEGNSEPLPASVKLINDSEAAAVLLDMPSSPIIKPLLSQTRGLEISL
jgi:hypothetical protein